MKSAVRFQLMRLAKLGSALACPTNNDETTKSRTMNALTLHHVNDQLVRVLDRQGECVGNVKLIGPVWKFKALGQDADGQVIPGGGPLTGRHNMAFAVLDEAVVIAALLA